MSFDLVVNKSLPYLQLFDLDVRIEPDSQWQLARVVLSENFAIEAICLAYDAKQYFHSIEADSSGRTFVWTAAPKVAFALPVWRGMAKKLLLEFLSIRQNQLTDVSVVVGETVTEFQCSTEADASGFLNIPLKPALAECVAAIQLTTGHFALASSTDNRLIGIAIRALLYPAIYSGMMKRKRCCCLH
ncbi:MAG: hypothetical protein IPP88_22400 [Betaproteobacteria bacterium]|nr:hypothetical protein [Betaproteobacteria bacterium]